MSLPEQLASQLAADDLRPFLALYFSHRGPDDLPAIHIKLHGLEQGQAVSTIRLDHIAGLEADPRRLAGRSFSFPVNPAYGYIDGSVYLQGRHQAVDVTRLTFGMEKNLQIPLEVTGNIQFEELPLPLEFNFSVPLQLPLDHAAMLALLEAGMQATSACTPRDMGRLMAYLKQHLPYDEQIADLAALAKARLLANHK
ncbi:hypothetical protein [Undibacterium pigrum]|uniref:Uncharacterized protein n=1 Tax=Undibacterium pigrum TaxID=401470 RepID=A0A318J404_9BURK|nr:hypothetical protein [Undibacterium pigrum]PXX41430.1 hypothetical protein DFR42_10781 [Undibacterium pigrum]